MKPDIPVCDAHTHVGKWQFDVNHHSVRAVAHELARYGVTRFAVIISVPESPNVTHKTNLALLEETHENQIDFFYWLDPRMTSIRELDSVAHQIVGVKLHPSYTRTRITDGRMGKFLDWCEANSKPLLIHCGRWNKYADYRFAVNIATTRKMILILAHMGGPAYDIKTNALDYIAKQKIKARLMTDTSTCFQPYLIRKAVRTLGPENLLFGSDYPLYHPYPTMQNISIAKIPDKVRQRILGLNYLKLVA